MNSSSLFLSAKAAVPAIAALRDDRRAEILCAIADVVDENVCEILAANRNDLSRMSKDDPKFDRLMLSQERLVAIANDMRRVANLPSPLGKILEERTRPNGLEIRKVAVPFGVIGVIYEARPNVTLDVFSLCFKSGNVCVLKGAQDAKETNQILVDFIRKTLPRFGVSADACVLLQPTRSAALELLNASGIIDVVIPRGSRALIDFTRQNASVPVIETGAGVCHVFIDDSADLEKASAIVLNSKTRRVSVCNALDCLLIHENICRELPKICSHLSAKNVRIFADEKAYSSLVGKYPETLLFQATEESFGVEFLDYAMSVRTVANVEDALSHIAAKGSRHSECIVAENAQTCSRFLSEVDAACVYANASTAFTDGGEFGFGAEIGISTQKLHARGPMGLSELTTYKYLICGVGQVR